MYYQAQHIVKHIAFWIPRISAQCDKMRSTIIMMDAAFVNVLYKRLYTNPSATITITITS